MKAMPMTRKRISLFSALLFIPLAVCLTSCTRPVLGNQNQPESNPLHTKSILNAVTKHRESFVEFCLDFELTSHGQANKERRLGTILRSENLSAIEFTQQTFSPTSGLRVRYSLSSQCSSGQVLFERILDSNNAPGFIEHPNRLIDEQNVRWLGALDPGATFPFGPMEPFFLGMSGRITDILEAVRNQKYTSFTSERDGQTILNCVVVFDNEEFTLSLSGDRGELIGFNRKWNTSAAPDAPIGYFEHIESIETKNNETICSQVFKQLLKDRVDVLREAVIKYKVRDSKECRAYFDERLSKAPRGLEITFKGSPQLKGVWTGDDVRLSYSSTGFAAVQNEKENSSKPNRDYTQYLIFIAFTLIAFSILVKAKRVKNA